MEKRDKPEKDLKRLQAEAGERLKELAAINQTTQLLGEGKTIEETLARIVDILPPAWQYPEYAAARIVFGKLKFTSANFMPTSWKQKQTFETIDGIKGSIEIFYLREFPDLDEGPFMDEERQLINNLTGLITGYLNSLKGRTLLKEEKDIPGKKSPDILPDKPQIYSRQLLQKFLNKSNYDRDIYHDLMPFKVKEILLVATRRSSIQPMLNIVKKAGLNLVGIKITTLGSFGLFEDLYLDSEQATAFIDIRDSVTDISFVAENFFRLSRWNKNTILTIFNNFYTLSHCCTY